MPHQAPNSNLPAIFLARGHTSYNYYDNTSGSLLGSEDALQNNTTNFYNSASLLIDSSDAIGTVTTNHYDSTNNIVWTATLDGMSGAILSSNSFGYDANGNRTTSAVWRHVNGSWIGATTTYIYDAQNRVIYTINPDGGTNSVVYNNLGKQQATIDPLGHTTSYEYDDQGRLFRTTYPDLTTELSYYDAVGNRTQSVDRASRVTTYVYDALNRLTHTIYPDFTTNTTVYDDVGRVAQTIDARGTVTAYGYDTAGQRTSVTNDFGGAEPTVSTYGYDENGNQITFTDANTHTTTNVFDALNRQTQTLYPDGTTNSMGYDADGRRVSQTNQDGIVTLFGYDGAGRLTSVTNALNQVTQYRYDEAGNEIAQIDALLRTNTFAYDGLGRRVSHAMPTNALVERFSYDLAGNSVCQTNFNGIIITNQYDEMNRLTNRSAADGYQVAYRYTPTGQRESMSDASGLYTYHYDDRDRLQFKVVRWTDGPVVTLNYGYDANGNLMNLWSSSVNGVTNVYLYDALNRLTYVVGQAASLAQYTYDPVGNLQAMRYGNGITNLYQYDALNRLTNAVWKLNVSTLASFDYQLGRAGNRTNLNEWVNGTNRIYAWQYDRLYRLTNENLGALGNVGYAYDQVGNRTNRQSTISQLPTTSYTYTTNDWLTSDGYDDNGNTTNSASKLYQYDCENRLTNYDNGTVVITYDGDGNRESKMSNGTNTWYLMDDRNPSGYAQVLEEWIATGTTTNLSRVYTYGLALISQRQSGVGTNYFVYDGHGSTRLLTDNSGSIVNTFTYDGYGNLIASDSTPQTDYLYTGQQFDSDLDFYYLRARYYKPDTGRFWTMDTFQGDNEDPLSLHKYLYCQADPVDNADPCGNNVYKVQYKSKFPWIDHRIIIGDTGTNYLASCYTLEFWGNNGILFGSKYELIKHAAWHYTFYPASASDTIAKFIKEAGHGHIDSIVMTSWDVDKKLNQEASEMDGKPGTWIFFFNDCGTGANKWLEKALYEQTQEERLLFPTPITGGVNYVYSASIDLGSQTGF